MGPVGGCLCESSPDRCRRLTGRNGAEFREGVTAILTTEKTRAMRKLRNDGVPLDIDNRLYELELSLRDIPGLCAVYLFGSYGSPHQTPLSDIDLALVFAPGRTSETPSETEITGRIVEALREEDVSVTILNRAPLVLQHKVLAEGRKLFLFDEIAHADFLERTLKLYCDFAVDYAAFLQDYDRTLAEEYADGTG